LIKHHARKIYRGGEGSATCPSHLTPEEIAITIHWIEAGLYGEERKSYAYYWEGKKGEIVSELN
jgi:hypothetical protein